MGWENEGQDAYEGVVASSLEWERECNLASFLQ